MDFPITQECSAEKLHAAIQNCPRILQYMPKNWDRPKKCDRNYLVGVLGTLHNQCMTDWAAESRRIRAQLREVKKE